MGIRIKNSELHKIADDLLEGLDPTTYNHSISVGSLFACLVRTCSLKEPSLFGQIVPFLQSLTLDEMRLVGCLHDVGKQKLDQEILHKPGKLTAEEMTYVKTHDILSKEMIEEVIINLNVTSKNCDVLQLAKTVAAHHHNCNTCNLELAHLCQIAKMADIIDALISKRSYKDPMTFEQAKQEMQKMVENNQIVDSHIYQTACLSCHYVENILNLRPLIDTDRGAYIKGVEEIIGQASL